MYPQNEGAAYVHTEQGSSETLLDWKLELLDWKIEMFILSNLKIYYRASPLQINIQVKIC